MVFNLELYWSVANGEFETFHVCQHSNMLIISPNCCVGDVSPFAFAFALEEVEYRGWITDEEDNVLVGNMEAAFVSELLNLREVGALVRGEMRKTLRGRANGRPRRMY